MTKMINAFTHTEMWVADDRVKEYTAAGHKLAAAPAVEPTVEPEPEIETVAAEEPKEEKKVTKKTTKKK